MKTREITLNALFIAITVVLAIVPQLGVIQIGVVSITIMHIPVIIAGLVLGFKSAVINALAFGFATMFVAISRGSGLLDPLFINPLVSVLPRLMFGVSIGLISSFMNRISKNQTLNDGVTTVISTTLHSVFVLSALFFASLGNAAIQESFAGSSALMYFFVGVFTSNALLEIGAALIIALPVTSVLRRLNRGRS